MINGGNLNVYDDACIISGPYTKHAVILENKSSATFRDSTSIYSLAHRCISGGQAGRINIHTNGNLFAKEYVVRVDNCTSLNLGKGHLASVEHTQMTRIGDNAFNRTINKRTVIFKTISRYDSNGKAYLTNESRTCNYLVRN